MATEADVRQAALALPGAYEKASFDDAPSFRTKPRMFCWIRTDAGTGHQPTLVLFVASVEEKEALIAADPDVYFTTPHYDGHAMVLARLDVISVTEMTEMITESYRGRAPKTLVRQLR